MSITIQCPNCGKRYTVDESAAGKVATCQACGVKMRIPAVAAAPPPPEPAPEPAPAPDAPQPAPPEPSAAGLPTEMRANRALEGRICPACGDPIQLGQPVRNCELCGRTHHADCWRKHNGCATLGCDNAPLPELGFAPEHQAAAAPGAPAPPTGETRKCPDCGEDVAKGESIKRFRIVTGSWHSGCPVTMYEGTAVGYREICRFPTVRTRGMRFEVLEADGAVDLARLDFHFVGG